MSKCVIFCAGALDGPVTLDPEDLVIAADGGLNHTKALGITPDYVLGDFDSLGYVPEGAQVFPVEKDDSDAMLAVRKGLKLGFREFVLYGCLEGKRLDHTVANFQTLQFLENHGAHGYLVGRDYIVTVVKNGTLEFSSSARGVISLFCMGPDARGVTLTGLHYPLTEGTLTAGHPLGLSNHFVGEPARILVKNGSLLAIWDRENGFPIRKEE